MLLHFVTVTTFYNNNLHLVPNLKYMLKNFDNNSAIVVYFKHILDDGGKAWKQEYLLFTPNVCNTFLQGLLDLI